MDNMMSNRILILEDDPYRIKKFLNAIPNAIIVSTAATAIDLLQSIRPFRYVFLDHDLGGDVYVDEADKNTGSEVVRCLCTLNPTIIDKIFIHSLNIAAAKNMATALRQAQYNVDVAPFRLIDWNYLREMVK